MPKFFNSDLADLAHQLTLSPRRLRMDQIHGIERLLGMIEPDRAYPFDFVCYHITSYRKRGPSPGASIPGEALISDLITTAEIISRKANLTVGELQEPYKTHQQVAEELGVSTKTVRRWRNRGLMGLRVVFEDGVNRLAFLQRTVDQFVSRNRKLVERGASFRQLSEGERRRIAGRASELLAGQPLKLHAAARIIADEMGRAVETVRYTLRRHDAANPATALFSDNNVGLCCQRHMAMWRCHEAGESTASIARAFRVSAQEVEGVLREVQVHQWARMRWDYVACDLFDAPQADALILDAPEPSGSKAPTRSIPADVPAYLRSLYRTPLLTPQQERDLFRRLNYLKYKITKVLASLDPEEVTVEQYDTLRGLIERAESIKKRIIQANLRLVVSIAKKHVGWSPRFFEVISDGNLSLMRAVEKFDFSRGTKFSTYATWAIVKNYARSIPEQYYRYSRYVTGQDDLLDATADHRPAPASESDRTRVRELIALGLSELSEREREVVSSHFGLGGHQHSPVTLEQLGHRFGVTKERIRQIEQKALARLRKVLSPSLVDALPN